MVLLNNPPLYFSARELFSIDLRYINEMSAYPPHTAQVLLHHRINVAETYGYRCSNIYSSPDSENLYKSIVALYQSSLSSPVVWNSIRLWEEKKEIIIFTCGWIRSKKDCRNACSTWLDFMKCLMVSHLYSFLFLSPRMLYTRIFVACASVFLFSAFRAIPAYANIRYCYYFKSDSNHHHVQKEHNSKSSNI